MINNLDYGADTPEDEDFFISQYAGGGTTKTSYYRRKFSSLNNYIKSKQYHYITGAITNGTINASGSLEYTATVNCVVYISYRFTANSDTSVKITIDGVVLVNIASGTGVQMSMGIVPFFLKAGQKLIFTQNSNTSATYYVCST